ncbi:MAG: adenylate/guanylate cyclase domain-containing protein, partial [Candidatus Nitrosopolaris sp.]
LHAKEFQKQILEISEKNSRLMYGLAAGIGNNFEYLSPEFKTEFFKIEGNIIFAEGLGYGLGYSFKYQGKEEQENIVNNLTFTEDSSFIHGVVVGLGNAYLYLPEYLQKELFAKAEQNTKFAKALGQGLVRSLIYFPRIAFQAVEETSSVFNMNTLNTSSEEISFSGQRFNYSIGFIDMMNSTNITSSLAGTEISRYYSIFLNAMATIANNFGAKIIKNAGDALVYYFPKASDINNKVAFKDVLECGITMMAAHRSINSKMQSERLPSVNYRISADYGEMQLARSISSQSEDLFGTAINVCRSIQRHQQTKW